MKSRVLVAVFLWWGVLIWWQLQSSMRQNDGMFVYALDDAYIHLTIARDLAFTGTWGISTTAFTGASSSPGWTILLAVALKLLGRESIYLPLALNALFTCLLLILLSKTINKWCPEAPVWFLLTALFVPTLLEPLPAIIFGGMEHAAHVYVMLALILAVSEQLSEGECSRPFAIVVLSALATAIRYESFLVIALLVPIFWFRNQKRIAVFVLIASLIPALIYGAYSVNRGWYFLPNSVIAKSGNYAPMFSHSWFANRASHAMWNVVKLSPVLLVLPWYYRARASKYSFWHRSQVLLMLAVGMATLHCLFAEVGQWLFRYEAYLWFTASTAMVLAIATDRYATPNPRICSPLTKSKALALAVALPLVCWISGARIYRGLAEPYRAMHDRFVEHIQEARFLSRYYDHSTVVLNDIGAASYYSHVDILDVAGLASREPLIFGKVHSSFTSADLRRWAELRKARIAILKNEWAVIRPVIPSEWKLVGEWVLPRNVVFGDRRIAFYAIDPGETELLRSNLKEFSETKLDAEENMKARTKEEQQKPLKPWVLYSFRHTFLTRLGESGCDAWTLARIAGHSNISISQRYVHPSECGTRCLYSPEWAKKWVQFSGGIQTRGGNTPPHPTLGRSVPNS